MPTVPFQERQVISRTPEIQGVSPVASGAAYGEVERAGYRMQQLGDAMTDFAAAQKRAEQVLELSTAKIDLDTAIDEHLGTYDADNDYKNYPAKYGDFAQKTAEAFQQRVSPEVWKVLEPTVRNKLNQTRVKVDYEGRKKFIEEGRSTINRNLFELKQKYAVSRDPLLKAQIEIDTQGYVDAGFMKRGERETELLKLEHDADDFASDMLIQQNPEVAYAALMKRDDSGQFVTYGNLLPTERARKIEKAKDEAWQRFRQTEQAENQIREDTKLQLYGLLGEVAKGKALPRDFLAEVERFAKRDPVTGILPLTGDAAETMKGKLKSLLKGDDEGKPEKFGTWRTIRDMVTDDENPPDKTKVGDAIDKAVRENKLTVTQAISLYEGIGKKDKEEERKQNAAYKVFLAERKRTLTAAIKNVIDANIPKKKDNERELNGLMSFRLTEYANSIEPSGDMAKDMDKINDYAQKLVYYQKKQGVNKAIKGMMMKLGTSLGEIGYEGQEAPKVAPSGTKNLTYDPATGKFQ